MSDSKYNMHFSEEILSCVSLKWFLNYFKMQFVLSCIVYKRCNAHTLFNCVIQTTLSRQVALSCCSLEVLHEVLYVRESVSLFEDTLSWNLVEAHQNQVDFLLLVILNFFVYGLRLKHHKLGRKHIWFDFKSFTYE